MRVYQAISWGKDNRQNTLLYCKKNPAAPVIRGSSNNLCFVHCLVQWMNIVKRTQFRRNEGTHLAGATEGHLSIGQQIKGPQ